MHGNFSPPGARCSYSEVLFGTDFIHNNKRPSTDVKSISIWCVAPFSDLDDTLQYMAVLFFTNDERSSRVESTVDIHRAKDNFLQQRLSWCGLTPLHILEIPSFSIFMRCLQKLFIPIYDCGIWGIWSHSGHFTMKKKIIGSGKSKSFHEFWYCCNIRKIPVLILRQGSK